MNPALRNPIASDYETIASWIPDAMACARWAGPHLRFPFVFQELPDLLVVPNACSFSMTMKDSIPLAFGQFWRRNESTVHLGRIIVSPEKRGRGYGKALCKLLIAEALHATNAEKISLRVYRDNVIAFSIYSALGFVVVESESNPEVFAMEAFTAVQI
jgi:ribosomal protein S18 acetylase RimI-like enzyme